MKMLVLLQSPSGYRARRTTLASIRETSLSTVDTLLDDVVEVSKHNDHPLSDLNDETNVQQLFESFEIKPSIPARLNELQFQLFTDFVFTWRFYFDDTSNWERSFSLFTTLTIGRLKYLGAAKINIYQIQFDPLLPRDLDPKNLHRLREVFRKDR